jgi:RNA polymerase sigma factor (sigma-70 family)
MPAKQRRVGFPDRAAVTTKFMSTDQVNALLEKLCSGDVTAAEQVLLAYEPYLRQVVRHQIPKRLRAKFDSRDVLQSVWVNLLQGFREARWQFANADQLRDFLLQVTRNRCIDLCRHFLPSVSRERPLAAGRDLPAPSQPSPSDIAQADDLWEHILDCCPPPHHELIRLKAQGLPLTEIALQTGLHEGSVRRILRTIARNLRLKPKPSGRRS